MGFLGRSGGRALTIISKGRPCYTDAFGPDSWFGGFDWLHGCRTAGTSSQHRFLPRASINFSSDLYPGSC
jgi:hypothetical protein